MKVTKKTRFTELMKYPKVVEALMNKGMHCFGCPFAQMETIEQGAKSHNMDVDKLIKEINKLINKKKQSKKK